MKYVIVTPVKNESSFIEKTINSIINQTILPHKWIIVDDGSSDDTVEKVSRYAKEHEWISLVKLETQNEKRSGGEKVVRAFNYGYSILKNEEWDFVVKLDGDLILPENYFEEIAKVFKNEKKVGLAGGVIMNKIGDNFVQESRINYHIRGAFKSFRKECFNEIGGFKPVWNWDGLDEMEAMFKGWETKCIDLKVLHLRPTTAAYNIKEHAYKSGFEAYKMRMAKLLLFFRFLHKLFSKPYILYSLYYLKGYLEAIEKKPHFIVDKDLASYINKFHMKRIIKIFL